MNDKAPGSTRPLYRIDDDVPIPFATRRSPTRAPRPNLTRTAYALEVGQSFLVTDRPASNVSALLTPCSTDGRRYMTRRRSTGVRVWRIS